jgi:NitT/TauT family transport system ATP-binding protein
VTVSRPDVARSTIARVTGLTKQFRSAGAEVLAVTDVDLEIRQREFLSLCGPSGCGKSTLLSMLGGLTPPTRGEVVIDGEPLTGPRRDIGMMFQKPVLFPWRTTLQNVLLPIEVFGKRPADYKDRARELVAMVGLEEFVDAYPWQLSGGMQQRAALCRVLLYDPKLLLLDEPFGALDEFTREAMDLELLRIWSETAKTIVFVTHNINEAIFMSDRVAVMTPRPGRIVSVLDTPLPRPRERQLMRTKEFADLVFEARSLLGVA